MRSASRLTACSGRNAFEDLLHRHLRDDRVARLHQDADESFAGQSQQGARADGSRLEWPAWRPVTPAATKDRVSGSARIQTAIAASQAVWSDGEAGAIVLARHDALQTRSRNPTRGSGVGPAAVDANLPVRIAERIEFVDNIFIATGFDYADALVAGPAAVNSRPRAIGAMNS